MTYGTRYLLLAVRQAAEERWSNGEKGVFVPMLNVLIQATSQNQEAEIGC